MNELYIGVGKGVGAELVSYRRSLGNTVYTIGSGDAENNFKIDWHTVNSADIHKAIKNLPDMDMVFFNQNSSALSTGTFAPGKYSTIELWKQVNYWQQAYFVSCQLPFLVIHELGNRIQPHTKVGWMLSHLIQSHRENYQYADYIGNKYQNYMLMKNFADCHTGKFFGIDPGIITDSDPITVVTQIDQIFNKEDLNGKVMDLTGVVSSITSYFD